VTPEAFSAGAVAWIDALSTIVVHLATKIAVILALPVWLQIRNRLDRHGAELEAIKGHITNGTA